MAKKFLISVILALAVSLGAETFAQERPLLPFYWIRGNVFLPDGGSAGAGRRVVLYLAANPAITAEAATDANGSYALNIYDLYYYRGANFTFGDISTRYRLGVRPDLSTPDRLGYAQATPPGTLDPSQGYLTQPDLALELQSGLSVRSSSIVGGAIQTANANLGIPGGLNQSVQLDWSGPIPLGTQSFALSMVDTTAGNFVHWLVINIPASALTLPADASIGVMPAGSVQLDNDFPPPGNVGYGGPEPPAGDVSTHNYQIIVYALSDALDPAAVTNLTTFTTALAAPGRVLGQAQVNGAFTRGAAAAGAVPLTITRTGGDVQISWNNTDYPNPRIFFRTGDGSGQFSNAYDAVGWTQITAANAVINGFDFTNYGSGSILHTGQVGAGTSEAYYKAVTSTTDVSIPAGAAVFESAGAVGKVNATLRRGWNSISAPFTASTFGGNDGIAGNDFGEGDTAYFWDETSQSMTAVYRYSAGSGWSDNTNILTLGRGCMINAVNPRTISLIGAVGDADVSRDIRVRWNDIGNPFPRALISGGFVSGLVAGDTISEWGITDFSNTIRWDGSAWVGSLSFRPGAGYWFNRVSNAGQFRWTINR